MTSHDNWHSTIVAWLKVTLPLLALAILSTLFLVSRTIDPNDAIPYSDVDIGERLREPRLTLPTWAGVTEDGGALSIKADEARPDAATGATAAGLHVRLETPDGAQVDLSAASGALDQAAGRLTVAGDVVVTTSSGYRLTTASMTAALDRTSLVSKVPVRGDGPVGQIDAGAMEIVLDPQSPGDYVLVFKQGVKLLYQPKP